MMRNLKAEEHFLQGAEACVEGALAAGCRFYAGYPITPSSEIMEGLSERLPKSNGVFIQMEDEIASIGAIIGASWTGTKAMTATSGPGFSLMQEGIGYAAMTETPIVIVDVQRGGPSTGQPTQPSESDIMQARWGSHGDYEIIAIAPNSVQEMFTLTVRAFNLAEKYRVPVILLSNAEIAHMREKVKIPENIEIYNRKTAKHGLVKEPFAATPDGTPPFPRFGHSHRVHVTGLTHTPAGYPKTDDRMTQETLVKRLISKINSGINDIKMFDIVNPAAKTMIVAYGLPSRAAYEVTKMRKDVGLFRLMTIWPFPEQDLMRHVGGKNIVLLEMNKGQLKCEVERVALKGVCHTFNFMPKLGGVCHSPREVIEFMQKQGVVQ